MFIPDLPLLTDPFMPTPRPTLAYRSSYVVLVSCPSPDLPLLTDHLMLCWYHAHPQTYPCLPIILCCAGIMPTPRPTLAYRSSYAVLVSCPPPDLPLLTDHLMLCWYHAHPQTYPCLPIILCCAGIMSLTHTLIMPTPRPTLAYRSSYAVLVSCHWLTRSSCPPLDLPLLTDHLMLCWYHVTDASNSQVRPAVTGHLFTQWTMESDYADVALLSLSSSVHHCGQLVVICQKWWERVQPNHKHMLFDLCFSMFVHNWGSSMLSRANTLVIYIMYVRWRNGYVIG